MRFVTVLDYSLDLLGGAQRAALNQASALVAAGHEVVLVAPRPRRAEAPDGVAPHWFDGARVPFVDFTPLPDDAALRRRLRPLVRRADALLVHSEFGLALAAAETARTLGTPVLHTVHTAYWPRVPRPFAGPLRRALDRRLGPPTRRLPNVLLERTLLAAERADVVISPSEHQADDLARLGVGTIVLPNCAAADDPAPEPLPDGPLHVAWIGRLVPEKRVLPFLAAVRAAVRRLPAGALRVSVAGSGPLRPLASAAAVGVPGLQMLGRLDRGRIHRLLAASHLGALTSSGFDNQPMAVVEAVRAGRGVLHVDPRLREGLDEAGLLARSPGVRDVADALVALALDPSRVRSAAAGALRARTAFDPAAHVQVLEAVLASRVPDPDPELVRECRMDAAASARAVLPAITR